MRERANAIAANFAELKAISKDNAALYEAGKRLLAGMGLLPFAQDLNADEIGGPAILDDLVDIASR